MAAVIQIINKIKGNSYIEKEYKYAAGKKITENKFKLFYDICILKSILMKNYNYTYFHLFKYLFYSDFLLY